MRKRRIERNLDHNEINKNDGKEIDKMLKLNKVDKGKLNHETILKHKDNLEINKDDYTRPSHWRVGMRDEVWDSAANEASAASAASAASEASAASVNEAEKPRRR